MNTAQATKTAPRSVARRLDVIKQLRYEHTRQFMGKDWASMQRVTTKIVKAWADYHFAVDCASERNVCFNCCGKPDYAFTVNAPERKPMLFCSAECRMDFGVSIGLT